ncbi:hypothetical protein TomTYG75_06960 [Sphingobium sp. TomTYG75]
MDIQTASADFDKKLLAHLTNMIGKPTPTSRELAAALDVGRGTIEASFYRLVRQGLVSASGTGNYRTISIKGVGDTLPRLSKADRVAANVEFEPVRIEATSCPRCGARNCQRHSAAFLTTSVIPAWRAVT